MTYDAILVLTEGHNLVVGQCAQGHIYQDSKNRFMDGTFVYTSRVESITDGLVKTRNTTYKIALDGVNNERY